MGFSPRDTEAVVGVSKRGVQGAACRAARDLDLMTPGSSPGRPARAGFRSSGVSYGTEFVIVFAVPVQAPLVHIVGRIVEAESIRRSAGDLGPALVPAPAVVSEIAFGSVAPGICRLRTGGASHPAPGC